MAENWEDAPPWRKRTCAWIGTGDSGMLGQTRSIVRAQRRRGDGGGWEGENIADWIGVLDVRRRSGGWTYLVVVGDSDELAEVSLGLFRDLHEVLAAVGHLHDGHAGALVVDQVLLAVLEDVEGQARGAGGEVPLAVAGRLDGDGGAGLGDDSLAGGHLAAGDGAGAEGHAGGHAESSHLSSAIEKCASVAARKGFESACQPPAGRDPVRVDVVHENEASESCLGIRRPRLNRKSQLRVSTCTNTRGTHSPC